ncbi:O-acetyl-ADP-ribose deacetylase [Chloroflexota bacterium]
MDKSGVTLSVNNTEIALMLGDITTITTDGIVNAANSSLMGGGGVDGAIHRRGGPAILKECQEILARQGRLAPGKAVITTGGNLSARYVIHTVGPIWHGGGAGEPDILASAYRESMALASTHNLVSLAFPSIGTGAYRYPLSEAARIAIDVVFLHLSANETSLRQVWFVLFNEPVFQAFSTQLATKKK